ncbi:MAG: hypothetical protein HKL88_04845, partial [Bacteroidia bacterium]|nr:hypothetical protein [Bacteroidia bacterium]
ESYFRRCLVVCFSSIVACKFIQVNCPSKSTHLTDAFKPGDLDSTLVIQLHAKGKDTILHMVHANVPEQDHDGVTQGWKDYYWLPMKKYLKSLKKS